WQHYQELRPNVNAAHLMEFARR
ncbi:transposase, partial [Shigella flexneri]